MLSVQIQRKWWAVSDAVFLLPARTAGKAPFWEDYVSGAGTKLAGARSDTEETAGRLHFQMGRVEEGEERRETSKVTRGLKPRWEERQHVEK